MMKPRVLIVEDEKNISLGMTYNFEKRGYDVTLAERGDQGLELAIGREFDLVVLDVMLPGLDGFSVCERLRGRGVKTPILMLTARAELDNRVKGLRIGADDYLAKPFALEELLVRAEALLRRRQWDTVQPTNESVNIGKVTFDPTELCLSAGNKRVELTPIECRLLQVLIAEQGKPVPRAQLLKKVWGLHEETQTRTLDNFIMRLRHHLNDLASEGERIESVRGVGYRIV